MALGICDACGRRADVDPRAPLTCPDCQGTLTLAAEPSTTRAAPDIIPYAQASRPGLDLQPIAAAQRRLLLWILIHLLTYVVVLTINNMFPAALLIGLLAHFAVVVVIIMLMLHLMAALGEPLWWRIVVVPLLLLPCVSLLLLLITNQRACGKLQKAGIRVGFLGASADTIATRLTPRACRQCGLDQTARDWRFCPECGAAAAE